MTRTPHSHSRKQASARSTASSARLGVKAPLRRVLRSVRRESFDAVAAEYDRVRPGYPESVFDRIAAYAELGADSRLLELGTGSGKATLPMARRGFSVVCLEP